MNSAAELSGLEVREELGRGAFTTVHRAVRDGREYAVKRPAKPAPDMLAGFRREAALLACIDDPSVTGAHAVGLLDGVPALVLQYIPGGPLADLIGTGALPAERAVEIAAQLARGLAAAHRVGLVHRDVKPGNIIMAPGSPARLIDFGLAQLGEEDEQDDLAVGTFLYASPEQSGMLKRPVDGRSDLYSLGVVLFECLTGRLPFESSDVGDLLRMHLVAPVPDLAETDGVPPVLAAVVSRLLAKDPDDRYPDAAALLADLRACPGGAAAGKRAAGHWPLCGRDAERQALTTRWQRARAGRGGVALIRGAAGSGRTRLADEAAAAASGFPVLRAAGQRDAATPLAALRAAVDGYLQALRRLPAPDRATAEEHVRAAANASGAALLSRLSPRLAELIGGAGGGEEAGIAAVVAFLADLSRRCGGLMLLLDDAQWLDPGSREVLARLTPELAALPLLVVLTELDRKFTEADLVLTCSPLAPEAVEELVASRLPGAAVTAELTRHVADRTGGSPLAVVAYLWQLIDAGLLSPLWGVWRLDEAGAAALPAADDVRALLAARLDGLPGADRDVLVAAALAGPRFRTEALPGDTDRVVAAVASAVERRVLQVETGGWYSFMHPVLRDELLDDRLREALHAALAGKLEDLPEHLRDTDHVYALARHLRAAGDLVDVEQRRACALAAGLRALDDHAAGDAIGYLEYAADGDPKVLHPLAVAYLRAGRFADAGATIDKALAVQTDRDARVRLLITEVELHHTVWADDKALDAAGRALAELGRPLPRVAQALGVAFAGGLARRTRWGFGTASGRRREELALLAATLDAGGFAAAVGLRLREAGILAMRALYAVNRLGAGAEYVRVYALLGYVAHVLRLSGTANRCLERAARMAGQLNDPALLAYVDWLRGCGLLFGARDDGSAWMATIAANRRWYGPAQLLPGHATLGLRLMLRGYVQEARAEYERGLAVLADPATARGTSFSMLGVMMPAMEGRPGEAATALADLRSVSGYAPVQRANILVAAACAAVEEGEFGPAFDAIIHEFRSLGLRDRDLMTQHKLIYAFQSHGRMAQLRLDPGPERLEAARGAVADLKRVRKFSPILESGYLIGESALAFFEGDHTRAIEWSDKAERVARTADAPLVHFEVARFRARAFRALGQTNEAERQARLALSLATQYGWEQRRRQARAEFGVERGGTARVTVVDHRAGGRRLEVLQQVAAAAANILDPVELARVTLDELLRILGAERALFFLLDERGEPVPYAGTVSSPYASSLVRRVAADGEALVLTGTEEGAALGSQSAVQHGLRSVLVVPVRFKGTTLGVIYMDSRMARGVFTSDDIEVLTAVSSHLAVSLETARSAQLHLAVQTARRQQAFAETLRASLAELSVIHDPAQLLRRLFTTLHTKTGATASRLLVADEIIDVAGTATWEPFTSSDISEISVLPSGELAVPLDCRTGRAGMVLLGGAGFDDSAVQLASALATQGMTAYDNAWLFSRVQELATTDELTGQHNRRHFYALAGTLVDAASRAGHPLAAAMIDIDKFKSVNDTYGHGVGDEVIRTVAARVRESIRVSDVLGRYGGEEFAVVLPDHTDAPGLAERMRRAVADTPVPTAAGPLSVTISVGLTQHAADESLDQLLARADHALYRAKDTGRNRVVVS
ncbi:diguanylate cyclase [Paractinoplanes atraurantiacus]|uniref:Diguanylate cyclase (GGDEF) domain-containing protein n=1 Tax=Paractinoplanes atraurantiacus TaxID=1036182 RepID=A0A285K1F8_9ACTN|nr:diguanylate cyclase [Actinoplanes atraurantiacus]SNY66419.1 diguanylate cyclase (GGDEF) domain-containing protein [Actinoplanes atraurantiacus]